MQFGFRLKILFFLSVRFSTDIGILGIQGIQGFHSFQGTQGSHGFQAFATQSLPKISLNNIFCGMAANNTTCICVCIVFLSLFRDQPSRLFALLWEIPGPFLDENRS